MVQRNYTRFLMSRDTELQVEVETWHFNNTNTPNRMHPSSTLAENCSKVFEPGLNFKRVLFVDVQASHSSDELMLRC